MLRIWIWMGRRSADEPRPCDSSTRRAETTACSPRRPSKPQAWNSGSGELLFSTLYKEVGTDSDSIQNPSLVVVQQHDSSIGRQAGFVRPALLVDAKEMGSVSTS